ncbi:molybdopterin-dependent oxidoreductase [Jatrophihabitans telluris]|uniref:Molybdopterin-dependent oxidoreductase n=1 Tax=Jatrophihabitans telluris TaxID=2038343 RepID=A0ABY4QW20_9ACTN|nr:molybdopterin-dependent oxidoreductase [Jatrophihabitans telluris]UQX87770.1 molybdopterin-dependent oxidoreductase [Jatrophihabitans telluris]
MRSPITPLRDRLRGQAHDQAHGRLRQLLQRPPRGWPSFSSPLRSTAVTARLGRVLGIAFVVCFATGLLSHYQYHPWTWLPIPGAPVWGYRLTQGVHVITGIACIPLILVKLWSVFHQLFQWPPVRGLVHAAERGSVAILVASSVLQLITGLFNVLQFYPWPWDFVKVHYWLSWVIIGSLLLHVAVQLPKIREGLSTPVSRSNPGRQRTVLGTSKPGGLTRRGVLISAAGGVGLVVATTVGQVVPGLSRFALLAPRRPDRAPDEKLPVNKTARSAGVVSPAQSPDYHLTVDGARNFELSLAELEALVTEETTLPIACVEGWSKSAHWRGPRLLSLIERAGGSRASHVTVHSLQKGGYNSSTLTGSQLESALLATHLNGERLSLDHGYPLRLIAADRSGVLQTKWLTRIEVR